MLAGMPNPPVMAGLATKRGRLVPLLGIGPATWHRRSTGAGSDARRELWRACSVADATPPNDHTTVAEMSLTFGEVVSASQISGARYQTVATRRALIWSETESRMRFHRHERSHVEWHSPPAQLPPLWRRTLLHAFVACFHCRAPPLRLFNLPNAVLRRTKLAFSNPTPHSPSNWVPFPSILPWW